MEKFKVWGNCKMCEKTIEGSLNVSGIIDAHWNKSTKLMEVIFDTTKIDLRQIQINIALVGYDTEAVYGDDKNYNKLPMCCQYERKSH